MRVTIKGLTASTIAFNTLGIILRGNSNNVELYPNSIARSIDIKNDDQLSEVNGLVNAKLISIEVEGDAKKEAKKEEVLKQAIEAKSNEVDDEISDAPAKPSPKKTSSKNKTSKIKAVKKKETPVIKEEPKEDLDYLGKSYVMTPSGAVEKSMVRSEAGEIRDSDKTKASIEALKKMEREDQLDQEDTIIDESKLDISERMGQEAIVSTGTSNRKVAMQNSFIPEAKQIRDKGPQFIDEPAIDVTDAFIDGNEQDDPDFIEI